MAHKIGLGRKAEQTVESAPEPAAEAPKKRRTLKTVHDASDQAAGND